MTSPRPMRLAYLTTEYPKVSHTFIRREIRELERRGHTVLRLAIRDSGGAVADPADREEQAKTTHLLNRGMPRLLWDATVVAFTRLPAWSRAKLAVLAMSRRSDRGLLRHVAYLIEAASLLRIVRREGIEHLHVHFGTNATAVARLTRILGGPTYSFTVHGPDEFDAPIGLSLREKIADAAFVVAITDYCSAQLKRWADFRDWEKIHLVHCTIDDAFFDAAAPIRADSRTLLCIGRLSAQKGQLLLLEAVDRLRREGVDLQLVLAGDGEMRPVVERRIGELRLADSVSITGWISEEQVREHLRSARALVLPSFAEGLPVVIMEALAMGRPVLSTRITGIPELVREGENGWLVTAGNVDELSCAMRRVMTADAAELHRLGEAGRQRTRQQHRAQTEVAKLEQLFTGIIEESRGGRGG